MNATCIMGQAVCRRACAQHAEAAKNSACSKQRRTLQAACSKQRIVQHAASALSTCSEASIPLEGFMYID